MRVGARVADLSAVPKKGVLGLTWWLSELKMRQLAFVMEEEHLKRGGDKGRKGKRGEKKERQTETEKQRETNKKQTERERERER